MRKCVMFLLLLLLWVSPWSVYAQSQGPAMCAPYPIAAEVLKEKLQNALAGDDLYAIVVGVGDSIQTAIPFSWLKRIYAEEPDIQIPWVASDPISGRIRDNIWEVLHFHADETSGAVMPPEIDGQHTGDSYWPSGHRVVLSGGGQRMWYGWGEYDAPGGDWATQFAMYHQGSGSFTLQAVAEDGATYMYPGNPVQSVPGKLSSVVWYLERLRPDAASVRWSFRVVAQAGTTDLEVYPGAWFSPFTVSKQVQYAKVGDGGNHLSQWLGQAHAAESLRTMFNSLPSGAAALFTISEAWERAPYGSPEEGHVSPAEGLPIILDAIQDTHPLAQTVLFGPYLGNHLPETVTRVEASIPQYRQAAAQAGDNVTFVDLYDMLGSWSEMTALEVTDVHLNQHVWDLIADRVWNWMEMPELFHGPLEQLSTYIPDGQTDMPLEPWLAVTVNTTVSPVVEVVFCQRLPDGGSVVLDTVQDVYPGDTVKTVWTGLLPGTEYQWFVETIVDGQPVSSPVWSFTTGKPPEEPVPGLGSWGVLAAVGLALGIGARALRG